jgi:hypothetical protein
MALASRGLEARERFSASNQFTFCKRKVSQLELRVGDACLRQWAQKRNCGGEITPGGCLFSVQDLFAFIHVVLNFCPPANDHCRSAANARPSEPRVQSFH